MFQSIEQIRADYIELCGDMQKICYGGEGFRGYAQVCDELGRLPALQKISQFNEAMRGWLRELLSLKGKPIPEKLLPTNMYLERYRRCMDAYEQATNGHTPQTDEQREFLRTVAEGGCLTDLILHEVEGNPKRATP